MKRANRANLDKLKWCFKKKEIKITRPSENIASSYLQLAKSSLKSAEIMLTQRDFLWTTVMIYYAEYYALYSFLTRIGLKCENHLCSILLTKLLLGEEKVKMIEKHKEKRIDAQYYLKIGRANEIRKMLNEAKIFIISFEDIVVNLNENDLANFRQKIENFLLKL